MALDLHPSKAVASNHPTKISTSAREPTRCGHGLRLWAGVRRRVCARAPARAHGDGSFTHTLIHTVRCFCHLSHTFSDSCPWSSSLSISASAVHRRVSSAGVSPSRSHSPAAPGCSRQRRRCSAARFSASASAPEGSVGVRCASQRSKWSSEGGSQHAACVGSSGRAARAWAAQARVLVVRCFALRAPVARALRRRRRTGDGAGGAER